jgi:histidinol-phosphate aminotransferase
MRRDEPRGPLPRATPSERGGPPPPARNYDGGSVTRASPPAVTPGLLVRPELAEVAPVAHGSVSAEELRPLGLTPADVLDCSVNTNPLGAAPSVLEAVRRADWGRYPGDDEAPLRRALARRAGLAPEQVALGNGSAELLWLIALATLRPGDTVAILGGPTFGEYARAARAAGAHVREARTADEADSARLAFLCNPNNPSGDYRDRAAVARLLEAEPTRLLALDEAYAAFVDRRWPSEPLLDRHPNLVIVRSLTKEHALPGLRLGYLLAAAGLVRAIEAVRPPWSVNAGALCAGLAALEPAAEAHVERARALVARSRGLLTSGLRRLGYDVRPAAANFVLVEVGDGAAFRAALLRHRIVVRDCASFGLPGCVRIACRLPEEAERVLAAVASLAAAPAG